MIDATKDQIYEGGFPDGWRARVENPSSGGVGVVIEFLSGDSQFLPQQRRVWFAEEATVEARGVASRVAQLWAGIARFLNAGGTLDDMLDTVQMCGTDLMYLPTIGFLLDTCQEIECAEHVFIIPDGRAVVWSEESCVEVMTQDALGEWFQKLISQDQ